MKSFKIGKAFPEQLDYINVRKTHKYTLSLGEDNFNTKINISLFYIFLILLPLFLLIRIFNLQIVQGKYNNLLSNENRILEKTIPSPRGVIFDRNGVVLVRNIPFYLFLINKGRYEIISRDKALEIESSGGSNLAKLEILTRREYIFPFEFAQTIGYLGEADSNEISEYGYKLGDLLGKSGIEEQYEKTLRGDNGKELFEVDVFGNPIRRIGKVDPKEGKALILSFDSEIQKTAYDALLDAANNERSTSGKIVKGAVVVSNPDTGEILALVSTPSFNPNLFTSSEMIIGKLNKKSETGEDEINKILNDNNMPLFNRAIGGVYPPGSTFKIIMGTAGLETGKINESTLIEDTGVIEIGQFKFPNWAFIKSGAKDGFINVVSALKRSNDIFFYKVGEMVGLDNIFIFANRFGLGKKLGIDIPGEVSGLLPTDEWKRKEIGDKWYLGDTYHLAIGQGYLLVTPLQVNSWTNVIANGGNFCKPQLIKCQNSKISPNLLGIASNCQNQCNKMGFKQKTVELIHEGMKEACNEGGTGWPLFNFQVSSSRSTSPKKIDIACKTGTAEYGDVDNKTHAWFTAFAPSDNPEITVTVLIEGGGEGSDVAAPVAKKIFETWFKNK